MAMSLQMDLEIYDPLFRGKECVAQTVHIDKRGDICSPGGEVFSVAHAENTNISL